MTKALSDDWMWDHGFVDGDVIKPKKYQSWWATKRVCDLPLNTPLTITSDVLCKQAIALLKREGFDMVPVLDDGHVIGIVTEGVRVSSSHGDSSFFIPDIQQTHTTPFPVL